MDELQKSNKELLKRLQIGQSKAWDILYNASGSKATRNTDICNEFKTPYNFSTPTKAYLDILDNNTSIKHTTKANAYSSPLKDILNISSSSDYGRPHKGKNQRPLDSPPDSPIHSPLCSENHREKLHKKLNASYSKLAADLRQIAPHYGTDLAYDLVDNSGISSKPDSYYNDIKKFRMANSELCSVKLADNIEKSHSSTMKSSSSDKNNDTVREVEHQCMQTYSVDSDYRAVDSHFGNQCPLCTGSEDSKHKGLIRVNIPNSHKVDYRVTPRGTDDTISLSSHCSQGWENHYPK